MRRKLFVKLAVLLFGFAVPCSGQSVHDTYFDAYKNLEIFNEIYKNLELLYVDTLKADETIGVAIDAMLGSLDPYTEYYPASKSNELKQMLTGKFAGIGALIRFNQQLKQVVIDEPFEGMPAQEVGLKKGDIIISIDDSLMKGKDVPYVKSRLTGDPGTTFKLKIKRPSTGKTMQMKVTRRMVQDKAVPFYKLLDNGIGYINLKSFTEDCSKHVRRAAIELKEKGMKSLILDLRGNGGGSEMEAVKTVNIFVPKDELITRNKGKLPQANRDYKTTVEPLDSLMPLVVLVNDNTASSSEIVSGAFQDLDRAVIMGTRTYGKGLVQIPIDLPYNSQMKVTTSKYYIPSGRCIQAINYRHSRGGYTEHVPDSLTHVFYTRAGREVRDGGGIKPDVEVQPDSIANITAYLSYGDSTEVMRNYEIDYIAAHPTIAPASEFVLSDADYEEFKARVLKSGFTYDRQSEKYIEELEKLIRFEGYYDDAREEIEALKKKLQHNVEKDLDYNREQICRFLESDIVAAYYYQAGVIDQSLRHDKQVRAACELLNDLERYNSILAKPKK